MVPGTDIDSPLQCRYDVFAVEVDKVNGQTVYPFFNGLETNTQGDGALLKYHRNLLRPNGIESPEDIQFALLIRGGVAKTEYFDVDNNLLYCRVAAPACAICSSIRRMADTAPRNTAWLSFSA